MKVLGWDTSARQGALFAAEFDGNAAAAQSVRLRVSRALSVDQRQHSEGLLLGIDETLDALGWKWRDVEAIAVGVGPGSFTGIRIGLTTARTLGQMLGISLIPVSSLESMEWAFRAKNPEWQSGLFCFEACMGEVYCRWSSGKSQAAREEVVKISRLKEFHHDWLSAGHQAPTALIAPGPLLAVPAMGQWGAELGLTCTPFNAWEELPGALSGLAYRAWMKGEIRSPLEVQATYLRASDAELKLKERLAHSAAVRG